MTLDFRVSSFTLVKYRINDKKNIDKRYNMYRKRNLIMPNSKIVSNFEVYDNDLETVQVEEQTKNMIE